MPVVETCTAIDQRTTCILAVEYLQLVRYDPSADQSRAGTIHVLESTDSGRHNQSKTQSTEHSANADCGVQKTAS